MLQNLVFAQNETPVDKAVAEKFQLLFNAEKFEEIFSEFSPDFQKKFPADKTIAFFTAIKNTSGNIVKKTFVQYDQGFAVYKMEGERAVLSVNISTDSHHLIKGIYVKPFKESSLSKSERNNTTMILPFKEEWTVIWGGDTKELNYHVENEAQKNAFDLVITDQKKNSFRTNGKTNEDYYAFGKDILSPCDGEVILVVDGIKDNIPGKMNPIYVPGNTVVLKTKNNEYIFLAHFKQHSIVVKQGQKINQGQLLGQCGNSGNSSEPHLHFHLQNREDMTEATGIKCYFENILVNGIKKTDYSPIQEEIIKNAL